MSAIFNLPVGVLPLAAIAGAIAFARTRSRGRPAGHLVWLVTLGVAFVWLYRWYPAASHCGPPATLYVPFIGAFTAASGAWCGITMGDDDAPAWRIIVVPALSAATALIPGVFFLLLLWPCR